MREYFTVFLSLVFLMAFTPAHAARLALVIGNGDYKSVSTLANPINDANDMAEVLKNVGFKVILKHNADKKTMVSAVQHFGARLRQTGSVGLFYFAGHGLQFNNQNFLMPIAANIKSEADIEFEAVDVNRVLAQLEQANNGLNIIILDACRDRFTARNFYGRGFLGRCLTHIDSPKGAFIAYATAPGKVAPESQGRNGTFTKHLLAALRHQSNLMIADLFIEVAAKVEKETKGQQVPWQSMSLTQPFCFGKCGQRDKPCTNCLQRLCQCEKHFKANHLTKGRGGNALACYRAVLKKDPNNPYALSGLTKIEARLVALSKRALRREHQNQAKRYLASLHKVNPESPQLIELQTRLHAQLLRQCNRHFQANRLIKEKGRNALACYQEVLSREPTNADALEGLAKIEARLVTLIKHALNREQQSKAKRHLANLHKVNPESSQLVELETRLQSQQLRQCDRHFQANRLIKEKGRNALACYKAVLKRDPSNTEALNGLEKIEARLVSLIKHALDWEQQNQAQQYLTDLRQVNPKSPMLAELEAQLLQLADDVDAVTPQPEPMPDSSRQLGSHAGAWEPEKNFLDTLFRDDLKDGSLGPEMVWIPAGNFRMGDIQDEGDKDEQPVHWVSVDRFAMGRYEVSFAEYDHFALATGKKRPTDKGWGRGLQPVIEVSWTDATAYAKWLSQQTGQKYRLPTEAEWEYAARAGTETLRYWGNDSDEACRYANVADKTLENAWNWSGVHDCTDGYQYTAPVDYGKSNDFGLFNTLGNVWEWTCSAYQKTYAGKEQQCIDEEGSYRRVVSRGGSWSYKPSAVRAANRIKNRPTYRSHNIGFRLVRE